MRKLETKLDDVYTSVNLLVVITVIFSWTFLFHG